MVTIEERQLDSDVAISNGDSTEAQELRAVVEADEALGYATWYTIGSDFMLPREWLLSRMNDLDLPEWMAPTKVTPRSAFSRTREFLIIPELSEAQIDGSTVTFEAKSPSGKSDTIFVTAETFVSGGEDEEGDYRQIKLGTFHYNSEKKSISPRPNMDVLDEGTPMFNAWMQFQKRALELFETHQQGHTGRDIQKMVGRFVSHWTDTIKLRPGGAVYFVPATYESSLEAMKQIVEGCNRYKDRGKEIRFDRVPVVDEEEEREMVERQARAWVEDEVESELSDAMETIADSEEEVVEEVIDVVQDNLEEADDMTAQYNMLLDTKLDVQEHLEDWLDQVSGGVEEDLIEGVIEGLGD